MNVGEILTTTATSHPDLHRVALFMQNRPEAMESCFAVTPA